MSRGLAIAEILAYNYPQSPKRKILVPKQKTPGKKIIVDIDNTLWDLSPVLWEHLRRFNPEVPPPEKWRDWGFWETYVSMRELVAVLRDIHSQQHRYAPYPEAKDFLAGLKEREFYIMIASHRRKDTLEPTERWLKENELLYDCVHLSYDKTVLFKKSRAIVDDNPLTLKKAEEAGIVRAGLLSPWNEDTRHPLFATLPEILAYLDRQIRERSPQPCLPGLL